MSLTVTILSDLQCAELIKPVMIDRNALHCLSLTAWGGGHSNTDNSASCDSSFHISCDAHFCKGCTDRPTLLYVRPAAFNSLRFASAAHQMCFLPQHGFLTYFLLIWRLFLWLMSLRAPLFFLPVYWLSLINALSSPAACLSICLCASCMAEIMYRWPPGVGSLHFV